MTTTPDVAIIGAGPSGLFMAFEAGLMGLNSIVIDALPQPGGQLAALYPDKPIFDVPGHPEITGQALVDNLMQQAARFNPRYLLGTEVTELTGAVGNFTLGTRSGPVHAKTVVVAGGSGMFTPRKPTHVPNLAEFEGRSVHYSITNLAVFTGQHVVVAGGGDSAVDWVLALVPVAAHVHLVHRRADFKAAPASVAALQALVATGKVTLHTPYQLHALHGHHSQLTHLEIADLDGAVRTIPASQLVCCFGLAPNPGALAGWGLGLEKGLIPVNPHDQTTARPGVLAVGDMATHPGKVPLIVTGFADAAVAAKTLRKLLFPSEKVRNVYSTSLLG